MWTCASRRLFQFLVAIHLFHWVHGLVPWLEEEDCSACDRGDVLVGWVWWGNVDDVWRGTIRACMVWAWSLGEDMCML